MVTRREDKQLSDLGNCVSKVRRTVNGNLLLEVAKGSAESAEAMKESIARVLGDAASFAGSGNEQAPQDASNAWNPGTLQLTARA